MACGCNGEGTVINGSVLGNGTVPISKIQWQNGTTLPAAGNWPVTKDMLIKYVADNTGGTVVTSNQALLIDAYGGGVGKTGAENRAAVVNAMSDAAARGISVIQYGYGTYIQDPLDIQGFENITIKGFGYGTKIQMSNAAPEDIDGGSMGGQGDAVFKLRACTNITIRDLRIDCEDSYNPGAGGIWVSGNRNRVENVWVANGDGFSICVIGSYSDGDGFVPTPTYDNVVYNCVITGQRRYHTIGGKAALLVAEVATRTLCEKIMLIDNFLSGGETGDYVGNDHGLYTTLRDIVCIKTTEGFADGAAIHLEGGESHDDMYVTIENMTAINFTVGTSVSENTKAKYIGENKIINCKYPVKNYANYPAYYSNITAIDCGAGLEASDTEGLFNMVSPATLDNCRTEGSLAKWDIVNYSGAVTATSLVILGGQYKSAMLAYENTGNELVFLDNTRITGLTRWQSAGSSTQKIYIRGGQYKAISGARIAEAIIDGITMKGEGTGTAIDISSTQSNTRVINSSVSGYAYAHANAIWGYGNVTTSIPEMPVPTENTVMRGGDNTRSSTYGNWTDELPSGVWVSPGNVSGAPFSSAYPFGRFVRHETNGATELGNPGGYWAHEDAYNVLEGDWYWQRHHATEGAKGWRKVIDSVNFPLALSSPADNHVLRYKSGQWVNELTAGNTASRPASGLVQGQVYYDTTLGKEIVWNGSAWDVIGGSAVTADASRDAIINGILLATDPPTLVTTATRTPASGTMELSRVVAPVSGTISKVWFLTTGTVGSGLSGTGGNGIGIYDTSWNRLAWADCTTAFTGSGIVSVSLNTSISIVAGTEYRISVVSTGTTRPTFRSVTLGHLVNVNIAAEPFRFQNKGSMSHGTTLTSTGWSASAADRIWFGFSN